MACLRIPPYMRGSMRGKNVLGLLVTLLMGLASYGQCPNLYDYLGNPSANPEWYNCAGGDYVLTIQGTETVGNYTINWGDGSPVESGTSLVFPASLSHTYVAAVASYTITFTDVDDGCSVIGTLVMEEPTSASIQVPIGGVTQACAPQVMEFINSSTNVSPNTVFTWDFGDGSAPITVDHNNLGQSVPHTYAPNTVDCNTAVTLSAENLCNTIQGGPSNATFDPIQIWDVDQAQIGASATSICWPANEFSFINNSILNCQAEGNIDTRYEKWNFGDYWGLGYDSIVDWSVFPPPATQVIQYPAVGSYNVTLLDSNFCGIDSTTITVNIVNPPTAGLTADQTNICAGHAVNFVNTSTSDANAYLVNFDEGGGWQGIGGNNFSHSFSTPGLHNVGFVSYVAGSITSCSDTVYVSIDVEASPDTDFTLSQNTSCGPATISITDNSTGAIDWDWDFGNGNTDNTNTPPDQTYTSPGTYTITLTTESTNGCTNTETEDIHIYNIPSADFNFSATCGGDTVFFTNQSTSPEVMEPVTSYNWDFDDGFTTTEQHPNHVYATANTYNVTLTASTDYCSSDTTIVVDVEAASSASFTPTAINGCTPLTVGFTNTSTATTSSTWFFEGGGSTTIVSPNHTFTNNTDVPQVFKVMLITDNALGCADTTTQDITVYPLPNAQYSLTAGDACATLDATFANLSTGSINYEWEFEAGVTSTNFNETYTFINNTTSPVVFSPQLTAINSFGCKDSTSQDVTVFPQPDYTFDISHLSACSPVAVTMPNVPGVVTYDWDFGNGNASNLANPTQIYLNTTQDTTSYTVSLVGTSVYGCKDTTFSELIVYPQPTSQFVPSTISGCSPLSVDFTDNSVLGETYHWNFGDGDTSMTSGNVSHVFQNSGNSPAGYNVSLEVVSQYGCTNTSSVSLNVFPDVNAAFVGDTAGCTPLVAQFDNMSTGASNYYWSLGNGLISINTNAQNEYVNVTDEPLNIQTYLVATSNFGCKDTAFQKVTIYPEAIANFNTDIVQGCNPLDVVITNDTVSNSVYQWYYGDGTASNVDSLEHTITYNNPTVDIAINTITLETTTEYGCTASLQQDISVFPSVKANFDVEANACSGEFLNFNNTSVGAVQYNWNFGDGNISIDESPVYAYQNQSGSVMTFPVLLTAESQYGCEDNAFGTVNIQTGPIASFNIDSNSICYPLYIEMGNNSLYADQYIWDYGDGLMSDTDSSSHSHTFYNTGETVVDRVISLVATNDFGCSDTTFAEVSVIPELIASFETIEPECHPLNANFSNQSIGALEYTWTLDEGQMTDEANPSYTYVNYGIEDEIFNVSLVVESYFGCTDTMTQEVIVHPVPDAEFDVSPETQIYPDATIDITDQSVYGTADILWDMGDGFTSDTAITSYTYDTYGQYFVTLTIDNGSCMNDQTIRVDIIPPPPTSLFAAGDSGCVGLSVNFVNLSEYSDSFIWNFGDGATSTEENPTHTYNSPGTFTVSLLATGPGGNDISVQEEIVVVYPNAIADFNVTPSAGQTGEQIFFYNLSYNATEYQWFLGNGTSTTVINPTHVFEDPGTYDITLVANNEYGCVDSLTIDGALNIEVGGHLSFPNAFTPSYDGANDGYYDPDALNNDVFHPIYSGIVDYSLQIYNRWGELLFESQEVEKGWNGFYNGQLAPTGVYVWRVEVTFNDNKKIQKAGDVTLLR